MKATRVGNIIVTMPNKYIQKTLNLFPSEVLERRIIFDAKKKKYTIKKGIIHTKNKSYVSIDAYLYEIEDDFIPPQGLKREIIKPSEVTLRTNFMTIKEGVFIKSHGDPKNFLKFYSHNYTIKDIIDASKVTNFESVGLEYIKISENNYIRTQKTGSKNSYVLDDIIKEVHEKREQIGDALFYVMNYLTYSKSLLEYISQKEEHYITPRDYFLKKDNHIILNGRAYYYDKKKLVALESIDEKDRFDVGVVIENLKVEINRDGKVPLYIEDSDLKIEAFMPKGNKVITRVNGHTETIAELPFEIDSIIVRNRSITLLSNGMKFSFIFSQNGLVPDKALKRVLENSELASEFGPASIL